MSENLLIVHGGGPTAVLNASLYGAIQCALEHGGIGHIYGANNGTGGVLREDFIKLETYSREQLALLLKTPGSAIGTSRDAIWAEDYEKMADICKKHHIRYVLFNGATGQWIPAGKCTKYAGSAGWTLP